MRTLLMLVVVAVLASATQAETVFESWEGTHTVLGMYGTGDPPIIAEPVLGTPIDPYHGAQMLQLVDNSPTETPQAYLAWIRNLAETDTVTVTLHRYDITPGAAPSCRLWGHWNDDPQDINGYYGSAGGNEDYGPGTGWDEVSWSWIVPPGNLSMGLVVEIRTYSEPGDVVWVDAMTVTAPEGAWILTPESGAPVECVSWTAIKALYR